MEFLWEITQRVSEGEPLLFGGEYLLASGCMAHGFVARTGWGEHIRYSLFQLCLKIGNF